MKILLLAGLFTVAAAPMAFADEGAPCQVDSTRRAIEHVITDTESGSAPAALGEQARVVRPPVQREAAVATSARVPAQTTQQSQRRRNGKRIPDAELIGPRGAL